MTQPLHQALRDRFAEFFVAAGHRPMPAGPLVPAGDGTLLFTNAGMVPFKEVFAGRQSAPHPRAVTCQPCMRVSGKHNDLDEVGRSSRHHTLFEMLGNFSFGDYFKEQAIELAWRFITESLGLPPARLWVTVFGGGDGVAPDDEAAKLWHARTSLPAGHLVRRGVADNFWSMGEVGPSGPCTEIYFDQGHGPVGDADFDSGRVMEIWNLVFMQFDRAPGGDRVPLPRPSVDTGMGLERVAAVLGGADSNYHTDLFLPVLDQVASLARQPYRRGLGEDDVAMRVLADHARAAAFLIAEGVHPANEGRAYVLRRILRRAIRHGRRLALPDGFLAAVTDAWVATLAAPYPHLKAQAEVIGRAVAAEEEAFGRTLEAGSALLDEAIAAAVAQGRGELDAEVVFRLHDTYGFPADLSTVVAGERGITVDLEAVEVHMSRQRARSRDAGGLRGAAGVGGAASVDHKALWQAVAEELGAVEFVGDLHEDADDSGRVGQWRRHEGRLGAQVEVAALVTASGRCPEVTAGEGGTEVWVVLAPTPFYGEAGGQVGDQGRIVGPAGEARVVDTTFVALGLPACRAVLPAGGRLREGDQVWADYAVAARRQLRAHHSATHLLHAALRRVLGSHVRQAGSKVDLAALRFDFSHPAALGAATRRTVEDEVNRRIAADHPVEIVQMSRDQAQARGAMALFGEKYGEQVRVITMGDSVELCGGTHASRTADIGPFLLLREAAVQSGVRRVVAEAGARAEERLAEVAAWLAQVAAWAVAPAQPAEELSLTAGRDPQDRRLLQAWAEAGRRRQAATAELAACGQAAPAWSPPAAAEEALREAAAGQGPRGRAAWAVWQQLQALPWERPSELAEARRSLAAPADHPLVLGILAWVDHGQQVAQAQGARSIRDRDAGARSLWDHGVEIAGVRVLAAEVPVSLGPQLRPVLDALRPGEGSWAVLLAASPGGRASFLVAISPDLAGRLPAGGLVRELAPVIGGRGGGRPELAEAGGVHADRFPALLAAFVERCRAILAPAPQV